MANAVNQAVAANPAYTAYVATNAATRAATHDGHQCAQQRATARGQSGPGFARRQQEADDDRRRKAEQHLVGVPQHGRHGEMQRDRPQKQRDPQRNRQTGEQRGGQVEGPEAQTQHGPSRAPAARMFRTK